MDYCLWNGVLWNDFFVLLFGVREKERLIVGVVFFLLENVFLFYFTLCGLFVLLTSVWGVLWLFFVCLKKQFF